MKNINDRRELANNIVKSLQHLVYGTVEVIEDIKKQEFTILIFNDINYYCDISENAL